MKHPVLKPAATVTLVGQFKKAADLTAVAVTAQEQRQRAILPARRPREVYDRSV